jgi:putative signal transducing protein
VTTPATPPPDPDRELVTAFASGNSALVTVARLLLQSEGIPFVTQGDMVQDFIGAGRFPGGFNLATGPVRFLVERRDLEDAVAVLRDLTPA